MLVVTGVVRLLVLFSYADDVVLLAPCASSHNVLSSSTLAILAVVADRDLSN